MPTAAAACTSLLLQLLVLILALLLCQNQHQSLGAPVLLDVHRMLQFDRDSVPLGSRRTYLSAPAITLEQCFRPSGTPFSLKSIFQNSTTTASSSSSTASSTGTGGNAVVSSYSASRRMAFGTSKRVVVMQIRDANSFDTLDKLMMLGSPAAMAEFLTAEDQSRLLSEFRCTVNGILVIVPREMPAELSPLAFHEWETRIAASKITIDTPVYFWLETSQNQQQIRDYLSNLNTGLFGDQWYLDVMGAYNGQTATSLSSAGKAPQLIMREAVEIKKIPIVTVQAVLSGSPLNKESSSESIPTIAIVAHYDQLGLVPTATRGMDSNGSGVIALLELARLFSKLYQAPETRPHYNLLFLLSGGGRLNYAGTRQWVQSQTDLRRLDNIEVVLCLDSIAGDHLYMHVSKKNTEENVLQLYQEFKNAAAVMNIPLDFVVKRINQSSTELAWEHEALVNPKLRRRVQAAATISHLFRAPSPHIARSSIADNQLNTELLIRNIHFIAESIATYISPSFGDEGVVDTTAGAIAPRPRSRRFSINSKFVEMWAERFASPAFSRPSLFLAKGHPVVTLLEKTLASSVNDIRTFESEFKSDRLKFYDNAEARLRTYRVKPMYFEFVLSLLIATYLVGVYLHVRKITISQFLEQITGNPVFQRLLRHRSRS